MMQNLLFLQVMYRNLRAVPYTSHVSGGPGCALINRGAHPRHTLSVGTYGRGCTFTVFGTGAHIHLAEQIHATVEGHTHNQRDCRMSVRRAQESMLRCMRCSERVARKFDSSFRWFEVGWSVSRRALRIRRLSDRPAIRFLLYFLHRLFPVRYHLL